MNIPSLPKIGKTLTPDLWTALCDAAVYSASTKGTRAWRDSTMPHGVLGAGADTAVLEDASGNRCVVENFARELDLNTIGINGWDGNTSISADMWAYLWLLAQDPDSQRKAKRWGLLASASHSAPTVDAAWTHKRLLSAARIESDGGSGWQIVPFRHSGERYQYSGRRLVVEYTAARSLAAQSLAAAVPQGVELAEIALLAKATSGTFTIDLHATGQANPLWSTVAFSSKYGEDAGPIYCPSQSVETAASTTGAGSGSVYVTGFHWPEGVEP